MAAGILLGRPNSFFLLLHTAKLQLASATISTTRRGLAAAAPPPKKGGAAKSTQSKKKVFDVVTDPKVLVSHCCGLNYKTEGEEVKLKPDSEYPDWLFTMDVKRPEPPSSELEPGTMEYFMRLRQEHYWRWKGLSKLNRKLHKY